MCDRYPCPRILFRYMKYTVRVVEAQALVIRAYNRRPSSLFAYDYGLLLGAEPTLVLNCSSNTMSNLTHRRRGSLYLDSNCNDHGMIVMYWFRAAWASDGNEG